MLTPYVILCYLMLYIKLKVSKLKSRMQGMTYIELQSVIVFCVMIQHVQLHDMILYWVTVYIIICITEKSSETSGQNRRKSSQ